MWQIGEELIKNHLCLQIFQILFYSQRPTDIKEDVEICHIWLDKQVLMMIC